MKEIKVKYQEGLTELEYLEKIYKKVKLRELVKFNGKAYRRLSPRNNLYYKNPNHFYLAIEDIYEGNEKTLDSDNEYVNVICDYKLIIDK